MKRIEDAFNDIGINIKTENGYRHFVDVLDDLEKVWDTLDGNKRNEIKNAMNEFEEE